MINLASNSPTRAKLLKEANIEFIQSPCNFDEDSIIASSPKEFAYKATFGKYKEALNKFGFEIPLLCADTVVSVKNEILQKAKDKDDARRFLELQSGNRVEIITCMIFKSAKFELLDISSTEYHFFEFKKDDLEAFLDSNEWMGKAGACMVEGFCKKYIKSVRGYESCAMGLTLEVLLPFLVLLQKDAN